MTCTSLLDFAISPAARCVSLSVFPVWSCLCWCMLGCQHSAFDVLRLQCVPLFDPLPFPDLPRSSRSCFLLLACQWPFWKAQHVLKSILPCYHVVWLCLFFYYPCYHVFLLPFFWEADEIAVVPAAVAPAAPAAAGPWPWNRNQR